MITNGKRSDSSSGRTLSSGDDDPARPPKRRDAAAYARAKRHATFADIALSLALPIAFIAFNGSTGLRDIAEDVSSVDAIGILVYGAVALTGMSLVGLGLDFYSGYLIEHRFGLSRASLWDWAFDWLKSLALQLLFGLAAIEVIYALMSLLPDTWWLVAAAIFIGFFIVLVRLAPVLILPLFFKFEPLEDGDLKNRLLALAERVDTRVQGVYVWKLGRKTSKSNAALMGWGGTRRIVVADTMIESSTLEEIEVVLAHELGHQVNRDIPRMIAVQSVIIIAGFAVIHVVLKALSDSFGFRGIDDFANLPLLLLVAVVAGLLLMPAINAYSRKRERAADLFALETTRWPDHFISAMEKLGEQNLSEKDPHPVMEFIFHSHPSLGKRIEFAKQWAATND
ncbi:MAG: M48 family metallopeptidase [Chloroflexi bacterium]|nr:M48 family metallopeptidase [Chloroflexota bacterium]